MHILVLDDEKEIADLIEIYLTNENFIVHKFYESTDILEFLEKEPIDLAVLDVMVPELDGFTLCQQIRKKHSFPILFVTAKVEDIDKINGLSIGADDYITKPFQPLELVARVKAQLRRFTKYNTSGMTQKVIMVRGLVINKVTHECLLHGEKISLTPTEFSILWHLCLNKGCIVKSEELFFKVWKEKYYENDNNTLMVHIRHLREKLKDTGKNQKYIETIWGVGYKIEK